MKLFMEALQERNNANTKPIKEPKGILPYIVIAGFIIALAFTAYVCTKGASQQELTNVVVDGSEMPGIGGTFKAPDIGVLYYNKEDGRVHLMSPQQWCDSTNRSLSADCIPSK